MAQHHAIVPTLKAASGVYSTPRHIIFPLAIVGQKVDRMRKEAIHFFDSTIISVDGVFLLRQNMKYHGLSPRQIESAKH